MVGLCVGDLQVLQNNSAVSVHPHMVVVVVIQRAQLGQAVISALAN